MTTEPNTAEEIAEYAVTEGLVHEIDAIASEIKEYAKNQTHVEYAKAHASQKLNRLKEDIEGLRHQLDGPDWLRNNENYIRAIKDVLNLIEEVSDE